MADLNENIQWTSERPLIVDNRTENRGYLKPYPDNPTAVDCVRIASAIDAIDSDIANITEINSTLAELKRNNIKGAIVDVTIPNTGWQALAGYDGIFFVDISIEGCTENLSPDLALDFESRAVARACGFLNTVETRDDALRVFAQAIPSESMTGKLTLLGAGCVVPSSNIIEVGAGLSLSDGVLSLTFATSPEVENLFYSSEIEAEDVVTVGDGMSLTNGVLTLDLAKQPDVEGIFEEGADGGGNE